YGNLFMRESPPDSIEMPYAGLLQSQGIPWRRADAGFRPLNVKDTINVLIIHPNPDVCLIINVMLDKLEAPRYSTHKATTLKEGLALLGRGEIDAVLADMNLPDCKGFDVIHKIYSQFGNIPLIIFSDLDDRTSAQLLHYGAQDVLPLKGLAPSMLRRAILFAVERTKASANERFLSLVDDLTGLYNRRGFFHIAMFLLKSARRAKKKLSIINTDIKGLQQLNERFGYEKGNQAIIAVAEIIRDTLRNSDLIARTGGDEYASLLVELPRESALKIRERMLEKTQQLNDSKKLPFAIDLRIGIGDGTDYGDPTYINDLLIQAEEDMKRFSERGIFK
ncbi:MAG TPA: diguanylate cyclase, partial [Elusimicrobiales bacterium]|nr:diguanylate cyclase [Elusimicrobiales bacterium]